MIQGKIVGDGSEVIVRVRLWTSISRERNELIFIHAFVNQSWSAADRLGKQRRGSEQQN